MKQILFILCFVLSIPTVHADDDTDRDEYCNAVKLLAFAAHRIEDQREIDKASGTRDLTADRVLAAQLLSYKAAVKATIKAPGAHPEEMCEDVSTSDEQSILKALK